jgi:hypothetical protein
MNRRATVIAVVKGTINPQPASQDSLAERFSSLVSHLSGQPQFFIIISILSYNIGEPRCHPHTNLSGGLY